MIVVLNGPLGVGKSTLAEALAESIEHCVWLDGDRVVAANPPASTPHLHETLALLVRHHRRFGYRHFVIDHFWLPDELADLCARLRPLDDDVRCFRLTLPLDENLRRIELRASARAIDEREFEQATVTTERGAIAAGATGLGEPFDVAAAPSELVAALLKRLAPF